MSAGAAASSPPARPRVWDGPLTLDHYLMGRDKVPAFRPLITPELLAHARVMVERANYLLDALRQAGVVIYVDPKTGTCVSSGWRPPAVNAATVGAAPHSLHMQMCALDLYDPEGAIDSWCLDHLSNTTGASLAQMGLWLEHPSATKGWCHVQKNPPGSRRRVFYP